ncbi:hypothetical protein C8J57DRAFT_1252328 [Mycena rebaudengoi]|nr:hypothetical protein C8J57DRAFT_1252328 [Mycena rebaudengoi]
MYNLIRWISLRERIITKAPSGDETNSTVYRHSSDAARVSKLNHDSEKCGRGCGQSSGCNAIIANYANTPSVLATTWSGEHEMVESAVACALLLRQQQTILDAWGMRVRASDPYTLEQGGGALRTTLHQRSSGLRDTRPASESMQAHAGSLASEDASMEREGVEGVDADDAELLRGERTSNVGWARAVLRLGRRHCTQWPMNLKSPGSATASACTTTEEGGRACCVPLHDELAIEGGHATAPARARVARGAPLNPIARAAGGTQPESASVVQVAGTTPGGERRD